MVRVGAMRLLQPRPVFCIRAAAALLPLFLTMGSLRAAEPPRHTGADSVPTVESRLSIPLNGLPIIKIAADFARPYVYAVEEEGTAARILVINTQTDAIERVLQVGDNVTDLDVHYPESRLYLNNYLRPETQRVDLLNLGVMAPLLIDDWVGRVEAGRHGRLYVRVTANYDLQYWIVDTTTGARVGIINSSVDFEDAEADPTGRFLYLGDEGSSGSALYKYDIATDDPPLVRHSGGNPYGSESLLMVADGSRLFWNETVYDTDLAELYEHPHEILAVTYRGHLAFSDLKAFNGFTGELVAYLPAISEAMAVSGNQQKLYLWDANADAIRVVAIADIGPVPALEPAPNLPDDATIPPSLGQLSWSTLPHAQSYDVYLGSNFSQVAGATPTSPTYLGRVTDPLRLFDPPIELDLESTYFWRVDVISGQEIENGSVWSFHTAPVRVAPARVSKIGITGTPIPGTDLVFSTNGAPVAWSATAGEPWLDLSSAAGVTPSVVTLSFDATGLPSGTYSASVDLFADGVSFSVPVVLELVHLRATAMVTDRVRPYYYVLHSTTDRVDNSYLAFVHADTFVTEKILPMGTDATDLSINYPEGRLYINNSTAPTVRVVNLANQRELPPLDVDMNVAVINAGRAGRIYVEDGYSWTDIAVVNSQTGAIINTFPGSLISSGDGAVDPTGNTYFHGDSHRLFKFDISTDNPTLIAEGPHSSSSIAFTLVLSADGQRVFYAGRLFDADLNELADFGVHVYALDTHGRHMVSEVGVIDATTGGWAAFLPAASTVTAVSTDDTRVIVTDEFTGSIMTVDLPEPSLFANGFENGATNAWTTTVGGG